MSRCSPESRPPCAPQWVSPSSPARSISLPPSECAWTIRRRRAAWPGSRSWSRRAPRDARRWCCSPTAPRDGSSSPCLVLALGDVGLLDAARPRARARQRDRAAHRHLPLRARDGDAAGDHGGGGARGAARPLHQGGRGDRAPRAPGAAAARQDRYDHRGPDLAHRIRRTGRREAARARAGAGEHASGGRGLPAGVGSDRGPAADGRAFGARLRRRDHGTGGGT